MRYRKACAASTSAAFSARRTCSGPLLRSTTRPAAAPPMTATGSIGRREDSVAPAITRKSLGGDNGNRPLRIAHVGRRRRGRLAIPSFAVRPPLATWHSVKFQAMPDEVVAEFLGDHLLQFLDLLVAKLNN